MNWHETCLAACHALVGHTTSNTLAVTSFHEMRPCSATPGFVAHSSSEQAVRDPCKTLAHKKLESFAAATPRGMSYNYTQQTGSNPGMVFGAPVLARRKSSKLIRTFASLRPVRNAAVQATVAALG